MGGALPGPGETTKPCPLEGGVYAPSQGKRGKVGLLGWQSVSHPCHPKFIQEVRLHEAQVETIQIRTKSGVETEAQRRGGTCQRLHSQGLALCCLPHSTAVDTEAKAVVGCSLLAGEP